jgi:hypothetical protein
VLDQGTRDRNTILCDFAQTRLAPVGNLLRKTELGTGPLWLLDAGGGDTRQTV